MARKKKKKSDIRGIFAPSPFSRSFAGRSPFIQSKKKKRPLGDDGFF